MDGKGLLAAVLLVTGITAGAALCEPIDYTIFSPTDYQVTHKDKVLVKLSVSGVTEAYVNGEQVAIQNGRIYHVANLPGNGENNVVVKLKGTDYIEEIPIVVFRKGTTPDEPKKLAAAVVKPPALTVEEKTEMETIGEVRKEPVTGSFLTGLRAPAVAAQAEYSAVTDSGKDNNKDKLGLGIDTSVNPILQSRYQGATYRIPLMLDLSVNDRISLTFGYTSYGKEGSQNADSTMEIGAKWYAAEVLGTQVGPSIGFLISEAYLYDSDGWQLKRKNTLLSVGVSARKEIYQGVYLKLEADVLQFVNTVEKETYVSYGGAEVTEDTTADTVNVTPEPRLSVLFYF